MECLPVETWSQIFLYACVDGGRTGCALSETCRYFRAAVLPVQMHSVALVGGHKAQAFVDVLENRAPEHRRVEHLFISQQGKGRPAFKPGVQQRLFELLAPTLRTFTSTLPQKSRVIDRASALAHPFPRLEELTMHGYLFQNVPPARGVQRQPFPALRRLHLLSSCDSTLQIVRRSPGLTHLRLSGVWIMSDGLYDGIVRLLGVAHAPPSDEPRLLPETLERLIVVLDGKISRFYYGQNREREDAFHHLKTLDKRKIFSLLETKFAVHGISSDTRGDWGERIVGKGGCWTVSGGKDLIARSGRPVEI
ncbi:uncharacterized protein PHACADRAFT_206836 [Phanerochaete carnosa HHB-10118-sp]|uniref:F-box domain-containing protein n=1 Tax=Phanerochaete carnosa (strain HHB-10118-sp) TaxID=650164 RepID=K5V5P1_PHACS|nr:uncharacterized protein PHACADRAFT_206836 [Phanerochaete carnosa HHB-10118-sp]EKM57991.1 hypothetical protein PHACADRAFT_206836 [Phanerochaete carnosa HHB-10118-sp]